MLIVENCRDVNQKLKALVSYLGQNLNIIF